MRTPIIIDTDIGGDIDDAYALAFAINSKELDIKAIITNDKFAEERAKIAKVIINSSKKDIPIFCGIGSGTGKLVEEDLIKNSDFKPKNIQDNLKFFRRLFNSTSIHYISIGSLSNLCYFLENIPKFIRKVKVIMMGGALKLDYKGREKLTAEWNIRNDITASKKVFSSDLDITLVPLDVTWDTELNEINLEKIKNSGKELNKILDQMWNHLNDFLKINFNLNKKPILHDPVTIALLVDKSFVRFENERILIDNKGKTLVKKKKGKLVRIVKYIDKSYFIDLFMRRIL